MSQLPNPLGGERLRTSWRGHDVAYVRRGEGPPIVLVHSVHACAWSMEWRHIVPGLASRFTTYSPDLLGFGASAHPPLDYTAKLYVQLLRDFLVEVVREPAVLVGSSLGGTYAIALAAEHPEVATSVCAVGPAGVTRLTQSPGALNRTFKRVLRSAGPGATLFSMFSSRASIRFFLKGIYADDRMLTDELVDLYWQSAHQPNAHYAPASFLGMSLNLDIRSALPAMACPFLLAWGKDATQTPLEEAAGVRALRPEDPFVVLPGGDLPHEESPELFRTALERFIDSSREPEGSGRPPIR